MCTAVYLRRGRALLGRTLDLEYDIDCRVLTVEGDAGLDIPWLYRPRGYSFTGMGQSRRGVPLMFDGVNEHGLAAAALNFPADAFYAPDGAAKKGIPSYALIPFILSCCSSVSEAYTELSGAQITDRPFDGDTPITPLHFIFADKSGTLIAEPRKEGLMLYRNRSFVLANSPCLESQLGFVFEGVPSGYTSPERFRRASELLLQREEASSREPDLGASHAEWDMLSVLGSVAVPYGVSEREGGYSRTRYISVMDIATPSYKLCELKARS